MGAAGGGGGVEWRSEERKTMRDQADKGGQERGQGGKKGYPLGSALPFLHQLCLNTNP
jgi:hypothetical protein